MEIEEKTHGEQVFETTKVLPHNPPKIKQLEMSKSPYRIIFRLEHSGGMMVCYSSHVNRSNAGMALPRRDGHQFCQLSRIPAFAELYYF